MTAIDGGTKLFADQTNGTGVTDSQISSELNNFKASQYGYDAIKSATGDANLISDSLLESNFLYASTTDLAYWLNDVSEAQGFNVRAFRNSNNSETENVIVPSGKNSNNYSFVGKRLSLGSNGLRSNEVLSSFDVPSGTYMWSLDATGQVEMYDYTTNMHSTLYDGLTIWNNPMCITDTSQGYTSYHLRENYWSPDVSGIVVDIGGIKFVRQVRIGDKIKKGDILYFGAPYFLVQNRNLGFRLGKDGFFNIYFKAEEDGVVICRSKRNNTSHMTGIFTGGERVDHVEGSTLNADSFSVRPIFDFTSSKNAFVRSNTSGATISTSSAFGNVPSADASYGESKKVVMKSSETTISGSINDTKISTDNSANGHANVSYANETIKAPYGAETLTLKANAFSTTNANYVSALASSFSTQKYAVLAKIGQDITIDLASIVNNNQVGSKATVSFYAEQANPANTSDVVSEIPVTVEVEVVEGPEQTIRYELGGGSGNLPSNATVKAGKSYTMADGSGLSKDGNLFSCWQLTYTPYGETDEVTRLVKANEAIVVPDAANAAITATAMYSGVSSTKSTDSKSSVVTVTWDSNAPAGTTATFTDSTGTYNDDRSIRFDKIKVAGSSVVAPGAPKLSVTTKVFDGWYDAKEGGNKVTVSVSPSVNMTYYAHWIDGYKVTYVVTGGDGATQTGRWSDGTTTDIEELVLPGASTVGPAKGTPVADDSLYMFYGWYTQPNGGGTELTTGTSFDTLGGSRTVYAYYDLANTFLAPATSTVTANPRNISGTKYSIVQVKAAATDIASMGSSSSYYPQYTSWMNDDSYHLYTLLKGQDPNLTNSWLECRIIHVGQHDNDGTGITFQSIHALPNKVVYDTTHSESGIYTGNWSTSTLKTYLNNAFKASLPSSLSSSLATVSKLSNIQAGERPVAGKDVVTTQDQLWILSFTELVKNAGAKWSYYWGEGADSHDGSTYAFWDSKDLLVDTKLSGDTDQARLLLALNSDRSGALIPYYTGQSDGIAWLRSVCPSNYTYVMVFCSRGTIIYNYEGDYPTRERCVAPSFAL